MTVNAAHNSVEVAAKPDPSIRVPHTSAEVAYTTDSAVRVPHNSAEVAYTSDSKPISVSHNSIEVAFMCKGLPREQYTRRYILLPPTATTKDWSVAATNGSFALRVTVGYSADDAGIGALDNRIVLAVNPDGWGGDLEAWFEQHYPGAQYVPVVVATPTELEEWLSNYFN